MFPPLQKEAEPKPVDVNGRIPTAFAGHWLRHRGKNRIASEPQGKGNSSRLESSALAAAIWPEDWDGLGRPESHPVSSWVSFAEPILGP